MFWAGQKALTDKGGTPRCKAPGGGHDARRPVRVQVRSNRSAFITLVQAATKSPTNFAAASSAA